MARKQEIDSFAFAAMGTERRFRPVVRVSDDGMARTYSFAECHYCIIIFTLKPFVVALALKY